ncbi:hypothetical protein GQ42DRAFT_85682 [Ramicandelaber brevisporus]|nr:hypothetical protein GQ42DRAFT_85682 [Ramicandelaber brevisporus]
MPTPVLTPSPSRPQEPSLLQAGPLLSPARQPSPLPLFTVSLSPPTSVPITTVHISILAIDTTHTTVLVLTVTSTVNRSLAIATPITNSSVISIVIPIDMPIPIHIATAHMITPVTNSCLHHHHRHYPFSHHCRRHRHCF